MPHDKRGTELQVGDTVMVPCRVKAIHLTEDYCNVDLETTLTMPPMQTTQNFTLNSRQTIKPTATHRFAEAPASSEQELIAATIQACANYIEANYGEEGREYSSMLETQHWGPINVPPVTLASRASAPTAPEKD